MRCTHRDYLTRFTHFYTPPSGYKKKIDFRQLNYVNYFILQLLLQLLTGILKKSDAGLLYYFVRYVVVVHAAAPDHPARAEIDRTSAAEYAADAQATFEFGAFVLASLGNHWNL